MAGSIIAGLLKSGHPPGCLTAADPHAASLARIRQLGDIATFDDNAAAVASADVVILAVKPQVMADVSANIADAVRERAALVISIAAGVTLGSIANRLGSDIAVVRCMPNTPALLGCGRT